MTAVGIDVSEAQGQIEWGRLEVDFVYRRVTNGTQLDQQWEVQSHPSPGDRGYLVGGYLVFYPWVAWDEQAKEFAEHAQDYGDLELPPALDCEMANRVDPVGYRKMLGDLIDSLEDQLQRRCIIYTRKDWWEKYATPSPKQWPGPLVGRDLWLARASAYLPRDACPSGWLTWAIWQKIYTATLPGIRGRVDLNEFHGSIAEMKAWAESLRQV
jgi:lysozyme